MKRNILILSERDDAAIVAAWLQEQAPAARVGLVKDRATLEAAIEATGGAARLLGFLTDVIVPTSALERLTLEPYNIHPGPPERPGAHPDSFALYEGAIGFGVTAHLMAPKVDAGAIVQTIRFPIPREAKRMDFADVVYGQAVRLFAAVAGRCAQSDDPLPRSSDVWRGAVRTKRDFVALCAAPSYMSAAEIARRQRACGPSFVGPLNGAGRVKPGVRSTSAIA